MTTFLDGLLTMAQATERVGKSRRTVERWIAAGRLTPAHKLPGKTGAQLFRIEDVDRAASRERAS